MKEIVNATIEVQKESTLLDHIKSDYVLTAQHLILTLLSSQDGMDSKTEEDVSFLINHLINAKDGLIDLIGVYIGEVDRLSEEIEDYLRGGEINDD